MTEEHIQTPPSNRCRDFFQISLWIRNLCHTYRMGTDSDKDPLAPVIVRALAAERRSLVQRRQEAVVAHTRLLEGIDREIGELDAALGRKNQGDQHLVSEQPNLDWMAAPPDLPDESLQSAVESSSWTSSLIASDPEQPTPYLSAREPEARYSYNEFARSEQSREPASEASGRKLKARELNRIARQICKEILSTSPTPKRIGELHAAVVDRGVYLTAEDPSRRLVQLLSGDADFVSDRRLGWSLRKGETPVAAGVSSATASAPDHI